MFLFRSEIHLLALREIIEEVDEDRSGFLDFEEFCQLSAKFLVEVDEEGNFIFSKILTILQLKKLLKKMWTGQK